MLQQTFEALERTFSEENDSCIDAAKGFVECACRVLIQELDNPEDPIKKWPNSPIRDSHPSFKNWVSAAFRLLSIVEDRHDPFSKVISQHYNLTEALGKFRDVAGPLSHGKEGLSKKLSAHHRRSAILAADALVTFLYEAYLEREPDPVRTLEPFERFAESNALIDAHSAIVFDAKNSDEAEGTFRVRVLLPNDEEISLILEPARLLFGVDRDGYKLAQVACREAAASAVPLEGERVA